MTNMSLENALTIETEIRYAYVGRSSDYEEVVMTEDLNRTFRLRKGLSTLKEINMPKKYMVTTLSRHPSERGWNRQPGHRYHYLSFPEGKKTPCPMLAIMLILLPEIQEMIMRFVVTLNVEGHKQSMIIPSVVTCNWKGEYCGVGYHTVGLREDFYGCNTTEFLPPMGFFQQHDEHGSYQLIASITKATIDATICRVSCFDKMATKMLYSENMICFGINGVNHRRMCPPSMLQDGNLYEPSAWKPYEDSDRNRSLTTNHGEQKTWEEYIEYCIDQLKASKMNGEIPLLEGWMYYDPFLRFIFTIGPKKAALIKKICIKGNLKKHSCGRGTCSSRCTEDIAKCIKLYIPFFQACLPSLEHLVILASGDRVREEHWDHDEQVEAARNQFPGAPGVIERAFRPLLEGDLRLVQSLKVIEMLDVGDEQRKGLRAPWEWAKDSIEWFANRHANRTAQTVLV